MPRNEPRAAALRVGGVKAVASEIEVRLPDSAQRGDPDIAAAAVRDDGTVVLKGSVRSWAERIESWNTCERASVPGK